MITSFVFPDVYPGAGCGDAVPGTLFFARHRIRSLPGIGFAPLTITWGLYLGYIMQSCFHKESLCPGIVTAYTEPKHYLPLMSDNANNT